ncbi:hypothetical protein EUGRSUZ_K02442 [Eucalyptus grandis]|uniref:Uncharacterized protein n=2 Tax=Eucalyptus grandis TaxID=71139 RepID=A0ACC3IY56_EUCGR|nr:hypothetical protein EUGRSUZ_K02442 [Eucalyptus grandis]
MMAPLKPMNPFNRPMTRPLFSGKFLTHVTRAPVLGKERRVCADARVKTHLPYSRLRDAASDGEPNREVAGEVHERNDESGHHAQILTQVLVEA